MSGFFQALTDGLKAALLKLGVKEVPYERFPPSDTGCDAPVHGSRCSETGSKRSLTYN